MSFDQTQSSPKRMINSPSLLSTIQRWMRREIVDDDPWDRETLFLNNPSETETKAQNPSSCEAHKVP